jgi:hypothetical protein
VATCICATIEGGRRAEGSGGCSQFIRERSDFMSRIGSIKRSRMWCRKSEKQSEGFEKDENVIQSIGQV